MVSEGALALGEVSGAEQEVGGLKLLGVDHLVDVVEVALDAVPGVDLDGSAERASCGAVDPVVVEGDGHRSQAARMHCC